MTADVAIIGGSGLYRMEGAKVLAVTDVPTPFGMPSDAITVLEVADRPVAFLPRHGLHHRVLPTEVPSRANLWALKSLGVRQIVSVTAVGSLQDGYHPGDFVLCDQFIDRTTRRASTFFGEGVVGHVPFADPVCPTVRRHLASVLTRSGRRFHDGGTLVVMEGPEFSTRAESVLHQSWGAACIGMTALPEARLAREAEICYAVVAMVTDYDCWHETHESVTMEMVLKVMADNTHAIQTMIPSIVAGLGAIEDCGCRHAAAGVIATQAAVIPYETRRRLQMLYGRYWGRTGAG